MTTEAFYCQECGRKFATVKAAEKAASVGCPKCNSSDIDDGKPVKRVCGAVTCRCQWGSQCPSAAGTVR